MNIIKKTLEWQLDQPPPKVGQVVTDGNGDKWAITERNDNTITIVKLAVA